MARTSGIPLVDLFDLSNRLNAALPPVVQDFTDRFIVTEFRSTMSLGAVFHHGLLQAVFSSVGSDLEEFDLGFGTLSIPLLTSGVPFQLSMSRTAISDSLEPASDDWMLDMRLDRFILTLDGLEAALYVEESGTVPRHLLRDPAGGAVKIAGATTLRLENRAGSFSIGFVDESDPLDPAAASGAVGSLTFSPPHFFFGSSEFGMTVGKLAFDFSEEFSPPNVLERGQGPGWLGMMIAEATIYAPRNLPGVGDLSGGVRNVLIGNPLGIQGEFEIQFGRTALNPDTFRFRQGDNPTQMQAMETTGTSRTVPIQATQDQAVTIHAGFTATQPPEGGTLQDWSATWVWPGQAGDTGDSSSGTVRHGQVLRVTPLETLSTRPDPIAHPEISFRFVAAGEGAAISATVGTETFNNVVHLNGRATDIAAITLEAISSPPGSYTHVWEVLERNIRHQGATFVPDLGAASGIQTIVLRETPDGGDEARLTRLRVRIEDNPALLVGSEAGVFHASDASTAITPDRVERTFDLSDFHSNGELETKNLQAVKDSSVPARVVVPNDGLAEVLISEGGAAPIAGYERHVQILMKYDEDELLSWGPVKPRGMSTALTEHDFRNQLLQWAARYPDGDFIVIGRCDDIGSNTYNTTLGATRAQKGVDLLTTTLPGVSEPLIPANRVFMRSEQDPSWTPPSQSVDGVAKTGEAIEDDSLLGLEEAEQTDAASSTTLRNGRLIEVDIPASISWPDQRDSSHENERVPYRRIDIYVIQRSGVPSDAARIFYVPALDPIQRLSMIPASGRATVPVTAPTPALDYRVKLLLGWDKPTANGWSDAIPNLAEAEFAWTPAEAPLPPMSDGTPPDLSQEVLSVYAKWLHDEQTGFTRTTLGIKSEGDPDGLISSPNKQLTAAMALAPALLSGVDFDTDMVGSGTRVAALLAGVGIAEVIVSEGSQVAVIAVEAQAQTRSIEDPDAAYQLQLTCDYVCKLHIDAGQLGLKTAADRPMKVRYRNVGLRFDNTRTDWEQFALVYDTRNLEIEDPGKWEIDGVLGELLRIVELNMGTGSLWIEGRLAIAINIGILEISEAIIRLTFHDGELVPDFELRGFVLKANIAEVIEGEGRLRIEDGGMVRAGVEVKLPALGVGGEAALALQHETDPEPFTFLSLFLGVQFSTPIPLANSGAALYGFKGLFTMNGERALKSLSSTDPIGRELEWWRTPPDSKYDPAAGQYALGVGVVVGTLPDASFCFSASGMVVVAFPDPEVILGVDVKVIEVPTTTATDKGGAEGTITGLIVIDDEAVTVAVSAQYSIPEILSLRVPFGAYFPYSLQGTYVRLGSDGITATINGRNVTRFGEPITLTLLPSVLDLQAWAYLMIEQDGLPNLGGDERFSFEGFSVGFGAGAGLEWSAGPIKLSASVKVLVGFGTEPLMIKGGVFVAGELDLVVLSISARGEIILTYYDEQVSLDGEFCGEVDLFFFSIKGCVRFSITAGGGTAIGPPPPPVTGISLTDRLGRIMGTAASADRAIAGDPLFRLEEVGGETVNTGVSPDDNHTVWADTAPVIHFRHRVQDAMPAGAQFDPGPADENPLWFGSSRQKWAYRIDNILLRRKADGMLISGEHDLQSTWTSSPYRIVGGSGADNPLPGEHEGVNLRLLDWDPWKWVHDHTPGGEGTGGDPAGEIEDLCDRISKPRPGCVYGRAARGVGLHRIRMRQSPPAQPPYPSKFYVTGEPTFFSSDRVLRGRPLLMFVQRMGAAIRPGRIIDLPFGVTVNSTNLEQGYQLPQLETAASGGLVVTPVPWAGRFDRRVANPSVTLLVCEAPGRPASAAQVCYDFAGVEANGKRTHLAVEKFSIIALDRTLPFTMTDGFDTSNPARISSGSDGRAEVQFADTGIEIFLNTPAHQLELYFVKKSDSNIKLEAVGTAGAVVDTALVSGPQDVQLSARLAGPGGIVRIRVTGGGSEAWLYRICLPVGDAVPKSKQCEDFRGLKPSSATFQRLNHEGFAITTGSRRDRFQLVDRVDQTGANPVNGRDKSAGILFPDNGIRVTMPKACARVEVWIMLFGSAVKVEGNNSQGQVVASAASPNRQRVAHRLVLSTSPDESIASLSLRGGAGEAVLFRICCLDQAGPTESCITFDDARITGGVTFFTHKDHQFTDLSGSSRLQLGDVVKQGENPVKPGADRRAELRFANDGLRIKLPRICDSVTIRAMTFGSALKAVARDSLGTQVDAVSTPALPEQQLVLRFNGPGIASIEIFGGSDTAVIYEICCSPKPKDSPQADPVDNSLKTLPIVRSVSNDKLDKSSWPASVLTRRKTPNGRSCRVIRFTPPRGHSLPETGFGIISPSGYELTLLSICGTDQVVIEHHEQDAAHRKHLRDAVTENAGATADMRREIVLDPGEDYEVEVQWSYQSWETDADAVTSPDAPSDSEWQAGTAQTFHFRVSDAIIDATAPQDGLNEYLFDPRDIVRYLKRVEPADGRVVQFTDDPIWVHFDNGHVEQLLEQYGRDLRIEVRRSDPPAQSGGNIAPLLLPLMGIVKWTSGPQALNSAGAQRINEAMVKADCLPDASVVGGASLVGQYDLEPRAMYDLNLVSCRPDGSERVQIVGTRFTTSRYANPDALIAGLGYAASGRAVFGPDEIILDDGMALPGGTMEVSDALLNALLVAIDADTLPLPTETGRSYVVWRFDGGQWLVEGMLIDSPERIRREGAVETPTGSKIVTRLEITGAEVNGHVMAVHRATENWTRVFVKPATPFSLPASDHTLRLNFSTSDGPLTGARIMQHLPAILEREGLV